ncbi:MAG TPA: PP2C family protein-serine/threonine phosphatase [Thermoanaerobaculia bacterium]
MASPRPQRSSGAPRTRERVREAILAALLGVVVVFLMFVGRGQSFTGRHAAYGALVGFSIFVSCRLLHSLAAEPLIRWLGLPRPAAAVFIFFFGGLLGVTAATLLSQFTHLTRFHLSTADLAVALAVGGCVGGGAGLAFYSFGLMRDRLAENVEKLKAAEFAEKELELARLIQKRLLPPGELQGEFFRVSARNLPARFMAGDFYDFFHEPDGTLGIVVADVLGKGIGASLIMASVKAIVPFLSAGRTAAETLSELNRKLTAELAPREFVALCFARLDPRTGRLEMANAGLPDPYLVRNGEVEAWSVAGPRFPLGVRSPIQYESCTVTLKPGEFALFVTDGLPEATTPGGDPFGYEALALAVGAAAKSDGSMVDHLIEAVRARTSATLEDDWTVLRLEQLSRSQSGP